MIFKSFITASNDRLLSRFCYLAQLIDSIYSTGAILVFTILPVAERVLKFFSITPPAVYLLVTNFMFAVITEKDGALYIINTLLTRIYDTHTSQYK